MVHRHKYLTPPAHPELTLRLNDRPVELNEQLGGQLNGSILLTCHEPVRLKSVVLHFQGKARVQWNLHGQQYKQDHLLYEHYETLCTEIQTQNHQWDFSLALPPLLPSTLDGHENASVHYQIKVTAERSAFVANTVATQDVDIVCRTRPQPELLENVSKADEAHGLSYTIQMPCSIFSPGSQVPVTLYLEPLQPEIKVRSVSCVLTSYMVLSTRRRTHRIKQTVSYFRDDHFAQPLTNAPWVKTEQLLIPDTAADVSCSLIKRRYKMKFTFSIIQPDGRVAVIHTSIPIHISHSLTSGEEHLPAYEEAYMDPLCDLALWTSSSSSDNPAHLTLPSYESLAASPP